MIASEEKEKAYGVPNLKLHLVAVNQNSARSKLNTNREVVDGLEALVRKLQQ